MFTQRTQRLSRRGMTTLIVCIAGAVITSLADGVMRGSGLMEYRMLFAWVTDFRFLFEQGVYAATLFWAAASFIETRTVLTIGFERIDAATTAIKGPDDDNIVWIGRRYRSRLEAEAVAAALDSRMRESLAEQP